MWALPLSAETYNSQYGFSIDIPSHWLILSKQEVKDNPDLFNFEGEDFKNVNKDLLNKIQSMVVSGQIELFLNQNTSDLVFNDNIVVMKIIEPLPQTASELNQYCTQLADMLAEQLGKLVTIYECSFKKIAGVNALYFVADGVVEGTRSIQVQIPKSPNVNITITATCKNETNEIISKEFEEIMASFTFDEMKIANNNKLQETTEEQKEEPQRSELLESKEAFQPSELQEKKESREIIYDDGSKYIGDIVNGKRHGQGAYIWADGRKYVGGFENNRASGGWFFKTSDHKVWVYQDSDGTWFVKNPIMSEP